MKLHIIATFFFFFFSWHPCQTFKCSAYSPGPVLASFFSFCLTARFWVSLSSLYILQFSASFLENSSKGEQHHHSVKKEQNYLCSFPSPFIHIINHLASQLVFVDLLLYIVVAQTVKNMPVMQEILVQSLGKEDPLEKGVTTYSSILTWRIPWTEKLSGLQSMESPRVRHNWITKHEAWSCIMTK